MKRAALAAAAVVLLLELALRAIGYAAPQWYQLDRELGWQLHPHRHGWTIAGGGSCRASCSAAASSPTSSSRC